MPHDAQPPRGAAALQAGGHRFDPGWLHWRNPCNGGHRRSRLAQSL